MTMLITAMGFSGYSRVRLVMLGWSKIIGRYNTPGRTVVTGPRK